ncbi:aspartic peptidase A1 [Gautieria morchelliformis]|nr:aspartic peptidase A1 [Gautieria morchelliformis]
MLSVLSLVLLLPAALALPSFVKIRNSPITLPIAARINTTGSVKLADADRARARSFIQVATERAAKLAGQATPNAVVGVPVTNGAVSYTASVGVGSPATQYTLIVDTGSSNTWVGANKAYARTATSEQTINSVAVNYGSGSFSGTEFIDQVTLAPGLVIQSQSIGVASTSTGFAGVDGILGIGPTDLTQGTLSPDIIALIPTVTDNLFSQGTIDSDEIGVSFEPATSKSVTNGEITFGDTDASKFTGSISFTPITSTSPASTYWGIDQSVTFGTSTNILSSTAGIVDTGTTLVLIATDAFARYTAATGGVLDNATGLLRLTTAQFANLQSLFFHVDETTFELTANAQAWPRSLNSQIGGDADSVYLIVADIGRPSGQGLDFINGFAFLERFYSVFDTTNRRVGLATTPFTHATTN